MEVAHMEEEKKVPIWKKKLFWIIGIIVIVFISSVVNSSNNIPEGIEENYYENTLMLFHKLNLAYEEGEFPSDDVVGFITDYRRSMEAYPSDYTEKEIYINDQLVQMLLGIGSLYESGEQSSSNEVNESRNNLASVLEVDVDY